MIKKGNLDYIQNDSYIGFDSEWTKNYKIKNGNIPFCFSIIVIQKNDISFEQLMDGSLSFKYIQYYCQDKKDCFELLHFADDWSKTISSSLDSCVLCGHQISSDFGVLYNYNIAEYNTCLGNVERLRFEWKNRKNSKPAHIIDTRYDINREFLGKSRRLVDMCADFWMDVSQPELGNSSMTKLQYDYYSSKKEDIRERISVMNLRHSYSAVVLNWLDQNISSADRRQRININKSVYQSLRSDFDWVNTDYFRKLLDTP